MVDFAIFSFRNSVMNLVLLLDIIDKFKLAAQLKILTASRNLKRDLIFCHFLVLQQCHESCVLLIFLNLFLCQLYYKFQLLYKILKWSVLPFSRLTTVSWILCFAHISKIVFVLILLQIPSTLQNLKMISKFTIFSSHNIVLNLMFCL